MSKPRRRRRVADPTLCVPLAEVRRRELARAERVAALARSAKYRAWLAHSSAKEARLRNP